MKVFFLGISGTLMGNIALMAKELGHDVIGVDDKVYPPMSEKLRNAEVKFKEGFVKSNFSEADIYIVGNVISMEITFPTCLLYTSDAADE